MGSKQKPGWVRPPQGGCTLGNTDLASLHQTDVSQKEAKMNKIKQVGKNPVPAKSHIQTRGWRVGVCAGCLHSRDNPTKTNASSQHPMLALSGKLS